MGKNETAINDGSRMVPEGCLYPVSKRLSAVIIGRPETMMRIVSEGAAMDHLFNAISGLQSRPPEGIFPLSTSPHSTFTVIAVPPGPLRSNIIVVAGQPSTALQAERLKSYMAACDLTIPHAIDKVAGEQNARLVLVPQNHNMIGMP